MNKLNNCPHCNADSEWIEDGWAGNLWCDNCDKEIIIIEELVPAPRQHSFFAKPDASVEKLEANITANRKWAEEEAARVAAMSAEERAAYQAARSNKFEDNSVWTR